MTKKFDKLYKTLVRKYGKEEIDKGVEAEKEHKDVVKKEEDYLKIVKAHEKEIPKKYYKELSRIEDKYNKKNKKGGK